MKKLKFNNGGQPIYLDDIQTLQNSMSSAVAGLVAALLMQNETGNDITTAFLSKPTRVKNGAYVGGWAYYNGELLAYTNNLTPATPVPSGYLNIFVQEADTRTMADGTSATCSQTYYATVDSAQDANAVTSTDWKTVPVMTELATNSVTEDYSISLQNGYTGSIKKRRNPITGVTDVIFNLYATNNAWADTSPHTIGSVNVAPFSLGSGTAIQLVGLNGGIGTLYFDGQFLKLAEGTGWSTPESFSCVMSGV
jgi:hypothetical protein